MRTSDFDYELPDGLIAQEPEEIRDACKLLVMDRSTGALEDRIFRDIVDYVKPGDLFVVNETRVLPARLLGTKRGTGGAAEVLLLREVPEYGIGATAAPEGGAGCADEPAGGGEPNVRHEDAGPGLSANQQALWEVLVKPGKRLKPGGGAVVDFADSEGGVALSAEIVDWACPAPRSDGGARADAAPSARGGRIARLTTSLPSLDEALHAVGHTPLPPYIKDYAGDEELYQTVYSRRESSAAAPTAGLHFTPELIERIRSMGAGWETVELEVGLDTFRIVDENDPEEHQMHTEFYTVPERTARAVAQAKASGGRVIAVGTTSVRSLESAWDAESGRVLPCERAATSLYLLPGSEFHAVDALITNFHVPRSTLMMLVSAFSSREHVMAAYQHAIDKHYRFFSFGDAMFIQ